MEVTKFRKKRYRSGLGNFEAISKFMTKEISPLLHTHYTIHCDILQRKKPDTNVSGMNNGLMDELYLCRKRLVPNQEKGISTHPPT